MALNLKGLFSGGLKGLGDTAKGIIAQVAENKLTVAEADILLEKEMNRHAETMEAAILNDVADARKANTAIQASDKASWMAKNIAYLIDVWMALIWGVFTMYVAALWASIISKTNIDMTGILSLYSTVTAVFMITVNFHRGTSQGSQDKQKMIDKLTGK